jgi:hypothetical protein
LIALLALALATVDISALVSMTSEPAADLVLALASSQVGLAAWWCGLGGGSSFVRLAVAGLLVNAWSSALGEFGHEMAVVLLSQLGVMLAAVLFWRLVCGAGNAEIGRRAGPGSWPAARVSLADMLALTTVFALLIGPVRTLVPSSSAHELKLLGAALGCQALAIGWAIFGRGLQANRWMAVLVASTLPVLAGEPLLAPARALRVAIASALLLAAALAVVRVCYRLKAPVHAAV